MVETSTVLLEFGADVEVRGEGEICPLCCVGGDAQHHIQHLALCLVLLECWRGEVKGGM